MDINSTIQVISNVGFPIALCVYMMNTMQKQSENHKIEIDELRKAIEQHTIVIVQLLDKLGRE